MSRPRKSELSLWEVSRISLHFFKIAFIFSSSSPDPTPSVRDAGVGSLFLSDDSLGRCLALRNLGLGQAGRGLKEGDADRETEAKLCLGLKKSLAVSSELISLSEW